MTSGSRILNISSLVQFSQQPMFPKNKYKKPMKVGSVLEPVQEITSPTDLTAVQRYVYELHPLIVSAFEENGVKYSIGNFSLKYVNLSYNWFGKNGLEALIKAVEYQESLGPQKQGPGIMYIDTEGRYPMINKEEAEKLEHLLTTRNYPKKLDQRHLFAVAKETPTEDVDKQP